MNGLDKLNLRLGYYGGDARSRLQGDKLHSLQKALLYSYQAETIALRDKREFRCLINTNKNTDDYDDKILSVPFEGICLNNNSCCCCDGGNSAFKIEEATNIEEGDVITWVENDTKWIIYARFYEETAYYRARMRRCTNVIILDDVKYWVALINASSNAFENKTSAKTNFAWNNPNAAVSFIISKDDRTLAHIHRYSKIKIYEESMKIKKTWKVINIDESFGDGVIRVFLEEDYENSLASEEPPKPIINKKEDYRPFIEGFNRVALFSSNVYKARHTCPGTWYIQYENDDRQLIAENSKSVVIYVNKTKHKNFTLIFNNDELRHELKLEIGVDKV